MIARPAARAHHLAPPASTAYSSALFQLFESLSLNIQASSATPLAEMAEMAPVGVVAVDSRGYIVLHKPIHQQPRQATSLGELMRGLQVRDPDSNQRIPQRQLPIWSALAGMPLAVRTLAVSGAQGLVDVLVKVAATPVLSPEGKPEGAVGVYWEPADELPIPEAELPASSLQGLLTALGRIFESENLDVALRSLTEAAIPLLGDAAAVIGHDASAGPITAVNGNPDRQAQFTRWASGFPLDQADVQPFARAWRTGIPQLFMDAQHAWFTQDPDRERRLLFGDLGIGSICILPLTTGEHVWGLLALATLGDRRYGAVELKLVSNYALVAARWLSAFRELEAGRRAATAQREMLASTLHDLKTPLLAIKLRAQLARQQHKGDLPLLLALDDISQTATRIGHSLNDLLDIALLEDGQPLVLNTSSCDLAAIVQDVVNEAQDSAGGRIELDLACSPVAGWFDQARVWRVLANLIDNARKYSAEGYIRVSLGMAEQDGRRQAIVTVEDRGVGIPPMELGRIFDRLYRASNVRYRFRGAGLGLYSARQIVALHGGTIEVASDGRGAKFTVHLPLEEVSHGGT